MRQICVLTLAMGMLVLGVLVHASAQGSRAPLSVVESLPAAHGAVDWTDGVVRATGYGVPPKDVAGAQAAVLARRAAIVDAQRNLLELVQDVRITATTTVRNAMVESDVITSSVMGLVRGAQVTREETLPNGAVRVEIAVRMYGGQMGLAERIDLPEQMDEPAPPVPPVPQIPPATQAVPTPAPAPEPIAPPVILGNVTGLLIDCRGMKFTPAMSPKILDATGKEVWGTVDVREEVVLEKGIAGYYTSVERAIQLGRVGDHPLVIRATGCTGYGQFRTQAVVSLADAQRILGEDARTHFLQKLAVGFLTD